MARGINKVILVGTLGKDPEVKYMPSGDAITNITLATNEQWKDKNTGEKKESTEWHRVVFFRQLAQIAGEYLRKGQMVYVEGSLRTRKWQDQSGQDRYTTEIVATDMQMLGGRSGDNTASGASSGMSERPQSASNQAHTGGRPAAPAGNQNNYAPNAEYTPNGRNNFEDFDDDIPF